MEPKQKLPERGSKEPAASDHTQGELALISTLNNEKLHKLIHLDSPESEYLIILAEIYDHIKHLSSYNCRREYLHLLSIYYYNQAYIYHKFDRLSSVDSALENSIKNYEYVRGFLTTRQEHILHSCQLVKIYLQHCTILSQLGKHSLSLLYAQKALEKLIENFRFLQAVCYEQLCASEALVNDVFATMKKICFKQRVLANAKNILDQLSCLPEKYQLLGEEKGHYEKIMSNLYYWKDNMEANEKIMKKELEVTKEKPGRNILGLPKPPNRIQDFDLGSLLSLEFKKIPVNAFKSDKYFLLSTEKLRELILDSSVAYFIIATESRFNHIEQDLQDMTISQKYKKLNHDNEINKCKIIHLKAIEMVGKYLPTYKSYFNHLLQSFNKNYKSVLDEIEEQSSIFNGSEQSTKVDLSEPFHEYGMIDTQGIGFQSEKSPAMSHKKNRIKHMKEQKKEGKGK